MVWINNPRYGLWPTVIAHTNTANYKQLHDRYADGEFPCREGGCGQPGEELKDGVAVALELGIIP